MTGRNIQRYGLCGGYGEVNGRQGGATRCATGCSAGHLAKQTPHKHRIRDASRH